MIVFCLNFDNLIIMYHVVGPFGFIFFGTFWVSGVWMSVSFPRSGKLSTTISLNKLSIPFSLSPLPRDELHICWLTWCIPQFHLLTLFFFFFFIFDPLSEWIPLSCPWVCWSFLPLDLVCWCSLLNFYLHLLYSSALWFVWYFLIFSLCWSFYVVHALFSWLQWASLSPLFWIVKQVSHFHFTKICFWSIILFFCLEHTLLFLHFPCLFFFLYIK